MKAIRLGISRDPAGGAELEPVELAVGDVPAPDHFWGSQVLIRLAASLAGRGFDAWHIDVRDSRLQELFGDDADDVESELLTDVRAGSYIAAMRFLNGPARGCLVFSIEFAAASGGRFTVDRDGIARLHDQSLEPSVIHAIKAVLPDLEAV